MDALDRRNPPGFQPFENFHIKEAITHNIGCGQLHTINAGDQDIVQLDIIFQVGAWFENKKGQSFVLGKMLKEGTAKMSSREISSFLGQYGAFLEINAGLDRLTISLFCLTKYLDNLLPVLKDMIFFSQFPEKELASVKHIKAQQLKVENKKNNFVASKLFRKQIFGEKHPYGTTLDEDKLNQISRKDIINFHQQNIGTPFDIVVSGKIDQQVIAFIEENLGPLNKVAQPELKQFDYVEGKNKKVLEQRTDSLQSSIRLGRKFIPKNHPDYLSFLVANEILGGYFGSRLMKNIREDKGYTYGIHSSVLNFKQGSYFMIGTDVKKEFTTLTLTEIKKEINRLQNELVSDEELTSVKNYMHGAFLGSITTPFSLADKFKSIYFHDLSYSYYDNYLNTIASIDAISVMDLYQKYLREEDLTEIVVGDYC